MWNAIKAEFKNILHNRLLLISTTVICIIPFLYSIFFLKSVWDPYGSTENLPVAVVNKDVPVEYRGQTMDIGHRMVKELKKNKQLKWEIVSPEKAHYGLTHRKYYTVVTIPKDFSKDATTVLDKHPKQIQLKYETNGSLNYIGQVISQLGMTKLNESIRAQVTRAYATAMFKALHTVGKGMSTASNGAKQLSTGMVTLQSRVNQFVAGVSQVNNGVQILRVSVAPLAAGAQQLASGSQTLANGIRQYTGGVGQLAAGLSKLNANSGALQAGGQKLAKSSEQFGTLNDGSHQVAAGVSQITSMTDAINGSTLMGTLSSAQGLGEKVQGLQSSLNDVESAMSGLQGIDGNKLSTVIGGIQQAAGSAQSGLESSLGTVANNSQSTVTAAQQIAGAVNKDPHADAATKSAVNQAVEQIVKAQQSNGAALTDAKNSTQGLQKALGNAQTQLAPTLQTLQGLQTNLPQLSNDLNNAKSVINETQGLMQQLNAPENQKALAMLSQMPGMSEKIKELNTGAQQVAAGTQQLADSIGQINALNAGIQQYTAGVAQAGAGQLTANSGQLNSGAGQLAGALGQLNSQVPALTAGVNQLAAGTQQLVDNSPALVQGIIKLNVGASKLSTALGKGAKTINGIKTSNRTAKMIAEPSVEKHSNYSYVPNYGHALAPYVLSVALYVGMLVFNFVYPIRRVADPDASATAWWFSKVVVGAVAAIAMAVVECGIMMMCGLTIDHVPSFFTTTILFGLASMAVVMFLSMTFDNPGRFVAMVLLMLQLGGSGGTFPMEVTMKFYNVIHWYLPMTYSILGLRDSISGGLGTHYTLFCNLVLLGIAVAFNLLLLLTMKGIASHEFRAPTVESLKANEHGPMGKGDGFTSNGQDNK